VGSRKRETKLKVLARFYLATSALFVTLGIVLTNVWWLVLAVALMFLAMWLETDANALYWEQWYRENRELIREQKKKMRKLAR